MWLRENGMPEKGTSLQRVYDAFPDVASNTVKKAVFRIRNGETIKVAGNHIQHTKDVTGDRTGTNKSDNSNSQPNSQQKIPELNISDYFTQDTIKDINKLKSMKQALGGDVNIKDVIVVMKELDILKPSKEVELKESLRNESTELIISLIMPEEYIFKATPVTTFDKNELASLIKESDL